jgi:hypothetical protein
MLSSLNFSPDVTILVTDYFNNKEYGKRKRRTMFYRIVIVVDQHDVGLERKALLKKKAAYSLNFSQVFTILVKQNINDVLWHGIDSKLSTRTSHLTSQ